MTAKDRLQFPEDPRALLLSGAAALGVALDPLQADRLLLYLYELARWNRKMNLTAVRSEREIVIRHFLDSLTPLTLLHPKPEERWIDIGTGAGFPGLVLKIARPSLRMTLVEAAEKKVAFLHHLIGLLKLEGVSVVHERLERLRGAGWEKRFDLLTTRALSAERVLTKGRALVDSGGRFLFFLARADRTVWEDRLRRLPGLRLEIVAPVALPYSPAARSLVLLRDTGPTPPS